jgi:hypothetical protein
LHWGLTENLKGTPWLVPNKSFIPNNSLIWNDDRGPSAVHTRFIPDESQECSRLISLILNDKGSDSGLFDRFRFISFVLFEKERNLWHNN